MNENDFIYQVQNDTDKDTDMGIFLIGSIKIITNIITSCVVSPFVQDPSKTNTIEK